MQKEWPYSAWLPGRGPGWPEGAHDVINKYGTYEVQATNGTENEYPQIAQGMPEPEAEQQRKAAKEWREKGK